LNAGPHPLALDGIEISGGIQFTFPIETTGVNDLQPGEVVLLVKSREAFLSRYGDEGLDIRGEYEGRLSNSGETLRIRDRLGESILSFEWSDKWYPTTDGGGYSLELVDPTADPHTASEPSSWRPSVDVLGTPGAHPFDAPSGGLRRIGDANDDGQLDISDPIALLQILFGGAARELACGETLDAPGNRALLDTNADGFVDLGDPIHLLDHLFRSGPPPLGSS